MCLAIPMQIKRIEGDFALVEAAGLKRRINIQLITGLKVGDYVMVHAGFAIEKIKPKDAERTLKDIDALSR
ncbi:MAG: HypC/HybG/HupF family hydrogenase formation chaperone [Candidatus Omnitrophica bacterium]|nr:HypC/HybG/HupF family hydrogenase formation chaperone [Candidatus Omnitrophota bacterium]